MGQEREKYATQRFPLSLPPTGSPSLPPRASFPPSLPLHLMPAVQRASVFETLRQGLGWTRTFKPEKLSQRLTS